jgi:hypothetical protein
MIAVSLWVNKIEIKIVNLLKLLKLIKKLKLLKLYQKQNKILKNSQSLKK